MIGGRVDDGRIVVAAGVAVVVLVAGGVGVLVERSPVDTGVWATGAVPKGGAAVAATAPPPPGGAASVAQAPPAPAPEVVEVRYRIEVRTDDPAAAGFAAVVTATLQDPRGWRRAGFDLVHDPGAAYAVVLAEPAEVDALCLPYDTRGRYSCQNGPVVALNADRWREATEQWPGDLESYRTMLVNHEVGHLLGMHHLRCRTPGTPAPVMEQQSTTLRGCTANPWPSDVEVRLAATHAFELAPPPRDVPFPP